MITVLLSMLSLTLFDFSVSNIVSNAYLVDFLYLADLILAIALIYIFYFTFQIVLSFTSFLGEFRTDLRGWGRIKYRFKILFYYCILTIPAYLAILSLVQFSPEILDYIAVFPVIISFLISLRILANYRLLFSNIIGEIQISSSSEVDISKYIKDQVTSFYFGILEVGIFVFAMGIMFNDSRNKLISNLSGLLSINLLDFIFAYILSLFILGLFSEWILESRLIQPNN